jgi:cytochrome c553
VIAEIIVCAGCHGMAGEGRPEVGYPPIAGQPRLYLQRQLDAFADGRRQSAIMGPIARWIAPADRERFATHFAQQPMTGFGDASHARSPRGRELAQVGDDALRVQACANCHGPDGHGQAPSGPRLAGLDHRYLRAEMLAWKEGRRDSDPSGAMAVIARHLSLEDIEALSRYYGR